MPISSRSTLDTLATLARILSNPQELSAKIASLQQATAAHDKAKSSAAKSLAASAIAAADADKAASAVAADREALARERTDFAQQKHLALEEYRSKAEEVNKWIDEFTKEKERHAAAVLAADDAHEKREQDVSAREAEVAQAQRAVDERARGLAEREKAVDERATEIERRFGELRRLAG